MSHFRAAFTSPTDDCLLPGGRTRSCPTFSRFETTCDETAAAVVTGDREVLVFGGRVAGRSSSVASAESSPRSHRERILSASCPSSKRPSERRNVAHCATSMRWPWPTNPALAGSLLGGSDRCQDALCLTLDVPLIAIDHLQAHIYACRLASGRDVFPCIGLIVSGGHSNLYRCQSPLDFTPLGGTIDDAAGEAFDKVAAMLGLGFPGRSRGPARRKRRQSPGDFAYRDRSWTIPHKAGLQFQRTEDGSSLRSYLVRESRRPPNLSMRKPSRIWPRAFNPRLSIV